MKNDGKKDVIKSYDRNSNIPYGLMLEWDKTCSLFNKYKNKKEIDK